MNADERAIRRVVADWQKLTANENVEGVLALMADDAVFLVAGHPPMRGRARFETNLRQVLNTHRIERPPMCRRWSCPGILPTAGACCPYA